MALYTGSLPPVSSVAARKQQYKDFLIGLLPDVFSAGGTDRLSVAGTARKIIFTDSYGRVGIELCNIADTGRLSYLQTTADYSAAIPYIIVNNESSGAVFMYNKALVVLWSLTGTDPLVLFGGKLYSESSDIILGGLSQMKYPLDLANGKAIFLPTFVPDESAGAYRNEPVKDVYTLKTTIPNGTVFSAGSRRFIRVYSEAETMEIL